MEIIFWTLLGLIIYTYIGYGLIVGLIVKLFSLKKNDKSELKEFPEVTLFVAAYNEKDFIDIKDEFVNEENFIFDISDLYK